VYVAWSDGHAPHRKDRPGIRTGRDFRDAPGKDVIVKIYVGNLSYSTDDEGLMQLFQQHGTVASANVVKDRDTGQSRGFGFVEMDNDDEARKAIESLDGTQLDGRTLRVNEARPKERRGGGGGRGGPGRGGNRW